MDPTKQWVGGEVLWILLINGSAERCRGSYIPTTQWPANVCNVECLIDGTFRNMEKDVSSIYYVGRQAARDVLLRVLSTFGTYRSGTFYHDARSGFAATSLFYKNPKNVKISAQI